MTGPVDPGAGERDATIQTERAVLGAMMLEPSAVPIVTALVGPGDYLLAQHSAIASAIAFAHADSGDTAPLSVADVLVKRGKLDEVGGVGELFEILEASLTAAGIEHYAGIVRECAARRRLILVARDVALRAADPTAEIDGLRDLLCEAAPEPAHTPAATVSWDEVAAAPSPEWLIDSLIATDSITMLASASTSGKSLLTLDWSLRMIHGMDWCGRRIRPGSVLYLCGEGAAGIGGRIRAWTAANPSERRRPDTYLQFSQGIPKLSTASGVAELWRMIADTAKQRGAAPALIVVDTLSQAFGDGDENDAATVAPALKALTDLRQEFRCAILILHHITKASGGQVTLNSVRGSGAFTANVDAVLCISVQDEVRTLRTLKLKDGEMAPPISFDVVGRETGRVLPDGSPERAPVIVPAKPDHQADAPIDADRRVYTTIGMAGKEGLTRAALENLTGLDARAVFEACVRLEREQTVVKGEGATPRYHWPAYAPKPKEAT